MQYLENIATLSKPGLNVSNSFEINLFNSCSRAHVLNPFYSQERIKNRFQSTRHCLYIFHNNHKTSVPIGQSTASFIPLKIIQTKGGGTLDCTRS